MQFIHSRICMCLYFRCHITLLIFNTCFVLVDGRITCKIVLNFFLKWKAHEKECDNILYGHMGDKKGIGTLSFTLEEYRISTILLYTSISPYIKKVYYSHFTHEAPQVLAFSILHLDFTEQIMLNLKIFTTAAR